MAWKKHRETGSPWSPPHGHKAQLVVPGSGLGQCSGFPEPGSIFSHMAGCKERGPVGSKVIYPNPSSTHLPLPVYWPREGLLIRFPRLYFCLLHFIFQHPLLSAALLFIPRSWLQSFPLLNVPLGHFASRALSAPVNHTPVSSWTP